MRALLCHLAVLDDHNAVGILHGGEPAGEGEEDSRSASARARQGQSRGETQDWLAVE